MVDNQLFIPMGNPDAKVIKTEITAQGTLIVTLDASIKYENQSSLENSQFSTMPALSQISSNSDLETFARAIVHDLRNPLSAIIGFSDMLTNEREEFSDQQLNAISREILDASEKLNGMLNTLSALTSEKSK